MPLIKQVMKACDYDPAIHTNFPYYATPKIDGIRFYIEDGHVFSASNKPIPNVHIQRMLPLYLPNGVDGELVVSAVGHASYQKIIDPDATAFQATTSLVMSDNNPIDNLCVNIFDYLDPANSQILPYDVRITYIARWFKANNQLWLAGEFVCHTKPGPSLAEALRSKADLTQTIMNIRREHLPIEEALSRLLLDSSKQNFIHADAKLLQQLHSQTTILTPIALRKPTDIDKYLERCLSGGYEGIMLRDPKGTYKFGRSTELEGLLVKYKPLCDAEAIIVGFEEGEHNDNPTFTSKLGKTVRSTSLLGKRPSGSLGNFEVELITDRSIRFSIGAGTGLTHKLRQTIWDNRSAYLGRIIKFSYLAIGTKTGGKPRMPKFLGFRDPIDITHLE